MRRSIPVIVYCKDILIRLFLESVLSNREGFDVKQINSPSGSERNASVVLVVDYLTYEEVEHHKGVVVLDRGVLETVDDGVVALRLPVDESHLVEGLLQAWTQISTQSTQIVEQTKEIEEKPKLLVVEDSPLQRTIIASALREAGFEVYEASDGVDGLEKALKIKPTLIITDVEMPKMNGLELCSELRKRKEFAATPILVLTTLSDYHHVVQAIKAGATDYLTKPTKGQRELFLHQLSYKVESLLTSAYSLYRGQILVAEDSAVTRSLMISVLSREGWEVVAAEDGLQAKELLLEGQVEPKVIITDIEMPRMTGLELVHWIRTQSKYQQVPILILSASGKEEHRRLGLALGAQAFLSKPFSEEKLLLAIDQVISRWQLENEKARLSLLLGKEVLDAVRSGKIEPQWKTLTILFSDIAGFSRMCSAKSAAEVVDLLNDYFDAMVEPIENERGFINKFIGDAIMALFSDLPGLEPGAVRAVRAAIGMLHALARFNQVSTTKLHMRIGINKGRAIVGMIGGKDRKDYTAIGDHVNRAQRLESSAETDSILISEPVWLETKGILEKMPNIRVKYAGELTLKGIRNPQKAWLIRLEERN